MFYEELRNSKTKSQNPTKKKLPTKIRTNQRRDGYKQRSKENMKSLKGVSCSYCRKTGGLSSQGYGNPLALSLRERLERAVNEAEESVMVPDITCKA